MAEVIPDTDSKEVAKIALAHWMVARVDNTWRVEDYKAKSPEEHVDKLLELFNKAYAAVNRAVE